MPTQEHLPGASQCMAAKNPNKYFKYPLHDPLNPYFFSYSYFYTIVDLEAPAWPAFAPSWPESGPRCPHAISAATFAPACSVGR